MDVSTLKQKLDQYKKDGISHVKIAIADIDGVLRGKYISLQKFESICGSTGGFCDCVFGWDLDDQLYDNTSFTGWHTAYPDALFRLDLNSERLIPEEGVPFFIADFVAKDGVSPHPVCPRNVLKRVLDKADKMGFSAKLAFEYEFFLFEETPHSIREKGYRDLKPFTPGMFGYSTIRNSTHSELFNGLFDYCKNFDLPIEGLHNETGPGVWEVALEVDTGLNAADKAALFKTFAKVFFQKRGLMATFMARWSLDYPGQSGHIHQSLTDRGTGKPLFYEADAPHNMSDLMKSYVAGQVKYLKPFLAMIAPTINSYTRLVKGFWAPTAATWGVDNRTAAFRIIPGKEQSERVEFRVGAADANPYLAAAAVIGAGLCGIEEKLPLGDPVVGNAYENQEQLPDAFQLPSNLADSARNFAASHKAKELFGAEFAEHFVATRLWEVKEHEKTITSWQLERYFEII
jgi:glutamine synthetase